MVPVRVSWQNRQSKTSLPRHSKVFIKMITFCCYKFWKPQHWQIKCKTCSLKRKELKELCHRFNPNLNRNNHFKQRRSISITQNTKGMDGQQLRIKRLTGCNIGFLNTIILGQTVLKVNLTTAMTQSLQLMIRNNNDIGQPKCKILQQTLTKTKYKQFHKWNLRFVL